MTWPQSRDLVPLATGVALGNIIGLATGWLSPGAAVVALVAVFVVALWVLRDAASWGCHTCANRGDRTFHHAPFVWLAKRQSIRHERAAHGFSVYDRPLVNTKK